MGIEGDGGNVRYVGKGKKTLPDFGKVNSSRLRSASPPPTSPQQKRRAANSVKTRQIVQPPVHRVGWLWKRGKMKGEREKRKRKEKEKREKRKEKEKEKGEKKEVKKCAFHHKKRKSKKNSLFPFKVRLLPIGKGDFLH
jgi:hypothetical protein